MTAMSDCPANDLLDLKSWLLRDLDDPDASVRAIAAQELAEPGLPGHIVDKLQTLAVADDNVECRRYAAEALAAQNRDRTGREGGHPLAPLTLDVLETSYGSPDPTAKIRALTSSRFDPEPAAIDFVRQRLRDEVDPQILAAELKFLARWGDPDDAVPALPYLSNTSAPVVLATLDVLGAQAPSLLLERLPELLTVPDLCVRARALRWLSNIDRDAAREHLSVLVNAPDPASRHVALKELLLSPANVARPLLLQLLGRETRPTLMVMAGLAIATNPDPALPPAVFAIALLSHGLKQQILQSLLNQLVRSIQNSGILEIPIDEYLARLKTELAQRKTLMQIRMALSRLASDDRETRLGALRWLVDHPNHPEVRVALENLASQADLDPEVGAVVQQLRGIAANAAQPARATPPEPGATATAAADQLGESLQPSAFVALSVPEQRRLIIGCRDADAFARHRTALAGLMKLRIDRRILIELIALFGRSGTRADASLLTTWLDADDPGVIAETVRAIGHLDPPRLDAGLQALCNHQDPQIRTAALEVFLERDKEQAVQHVSVMLLAAQRQQRLLGLSLMPRLDFSTAEPLLLDFVRRERDRELLTLASYLLAANLSLDGMLAVFQATHDEDGNPRRETGTIWEDALNTTELAEPGSNFATRVAERTATARTAREKAVRSRPRNAPPPRPTPAAARASAEADDEKRRWLVLIGIMVLSLVATMTIHRLFMSGRDDTAARPASTDEQSGRFRLPTGKIDLEGPISFVDPAGNGVLVTNTRDAVRWFVTFKSPQAKKYNKGDQYKGTVRATGHQRGTIIAEPWQ